jgi:hypothetical protein
MPQKSFNAPKQQISDEAVSRERRNQSDVKKER